MSKNKRGKKSKLKGEVKIFDDSLSTDFLCPICLEILVEPVQLPCKHELCIQCFQTHVLSLDFFCSSFSTTRGKLTTDYLLTFSF